jgi:hypothetical protein
MLGAVQYDFGQHGKEPGYLSGWVGVLLAKVSTKWPDNGSPRSGEMPNRRDGEPTVRSSRKSSEIAIALRRPGLFFPAYPLKCHWLHEDGPFFPASRSEETTQSLTNPTISSQATIGVYHKPSDDISPLNGSGCAFQTKEEQPAQPRGTVGPGVSPA